MGSWPWRPSKRAFAPSGVERGAMPVDFVDASSERRHVCAWQPSNFEGCHAAYRYALTSVAASGPMPSVTGIFSLRSCNKISVWPPIVALPCPRRH